MDQDVLGTSICPTDFNEAARRHGRHMARYMLARKYAAGKRCLDVACGSGFGSAYLAEVAASVLGMDLDAEMVEFAGGHYSRPNLEFRRSDLHEPIVGGPFDLITSFETLEHVHDPTRCLDMLANALRPDGVAMISVPNGTKELREASEKPYHQKHFSAEEFQTLLERRFSRVELFSQVYRKGMRHYLRRLVGRGSHHACDYCLVPDLSGRAKTWLTICTGVRI